MSHNSIIKLDHYGIIKISGAAAATFLQGQFTCDINEVSDSRFRLTAYCNPQGRIWFVGRLWQQGADYFVHLPKELIEPVINDLGKYALFSKVTVEHLENYSSLALITESVKDVLPAISFPYETLTTVNVGKTSVLCIDTQRWLIIAPTEELQEYYILLNKQNYTTVETNTWDLAEIRAGIPTIWQATMTQLLPHDINLPELGAVNFNKGCYKGQEIIARMQYRGQRKKQMYHISCSSSVQPQPGNKISESSGKEIGEIVSTAYTNSGSYELLAILPISADEQQTPLFIQEQPVILSNSSTLYVGNES